MGFCHRCGEITRGKCSKCGGRSVESTISCLVSEVGGVSIVDKWQSQYAGTILAPEEMIKKSNQNAKRIPTAQSAFYTNKKVCSCCSKALYHTTILEDDVPYCKECHLKLYNKGHCPSCNQPISENDAWIEHVDKKWHKECFVCFNCKKSLESNPLIDLQNRPCCEPCFMLQAGTKSNSIRRPSYNDDSISSQSSLSSLGSTRSSILLSKYNSSRPRLDGDLFQPSLSTPPLSRTPSPEDSPDLLSKRKSSHRPRLAIPKEQMSTPLVNTASVSSPVIKSISQKPCQYCREPLGDTGKKLKLALSSGQYAWFHKACFLCSRCHLPFDNNECATDGKAVYHLNCNSKIKSITLSVLHVKEDAVKLYPLESPFLKSTTYLTASLVMIYTHSPRFVQECCRD
ncbi:hypothetical protein G6F46_006342 [Rhizopus delemar]|uniref:LIM zinc-binding domain-containing protein n=2 Tax=Rhizopus TaxID=4842 RepID=A0A9P6Z3G4_9FUNG|nr:hypothetical protein G6F55_004944 [Rhizopus delemar]KAG1550053.1 hypothetical protein G6F51_002683 [Rhizopus arrhizus]KAG1502841.1 hypothetical protein G6F54_002082 [Rhizopus delemar]KAG1511375.1 hypothetical protein G6F53_005991 [Rhizopus delemar]KAG1526637.1 hypothetical protein G6F52_002257 [Rhizopus delemar]